MQTLTNYQKNLEYKKKQNIARFMSYVLPEPNTGCWLWEGAVNCGGYGKFQMNCKPEMAHRASFVLFKGRLLKGENVLHKCDTPNCVNPEHLFKGTQTTNMLDAEQKGRFDNKGEASVLAKLSEEDVRAIKSDIRLHRVIAKEYGVSRQTIGMIKSKKRWAHV